MYICTEYIYEKRCQLPMTSYQLAKVASLNMHGVFYYLSCQVSTTRATQSPAEVHPIPHLHPLIMESHNAALYGPYQPCPIVERDFTPNDVTQLKTKLAELVTYVHNLSLSLLPFHDFSCFSLWSAGISLPARYICYHRALITFQPLLYSQRCRSPSANHQ